MIRLCTGGRVSKAPWCLLMNSGYKASTGLGDIVQLGNRTGTERNHDTAPRRHGAHDRSSTSGYQWPAVRPLHLCDACQLFTNSVEVNSIMKAFLLLAFHQSVASSPPSANRRSGQNPCSPQMAASTAAHKSIQNKYLAKKLPDSPYFMTTRSARTLHKSLTICTH